MTKSKWRTLIITSAVIVATMVYGISQYNSLPKVLVTHWGFNNQPNGWMPKAMVVFGLPLLMLVFHWVCLGATYWAESRGQGAPRMERVVAWIFPMITIVAYASTIRYAQGAAINTRLLAIAIVGVIFILIGNYLPTVPTETAKTYVGFGYRAPWPVKNPAGARKTMRIMGYVMVAGGVLMLASLFFPAIVSIIFLFAVIAAILAVFGLSYFWTARA